VLQHCLSGFVVVAAFCVLVCVCVYFVVIYYFSSLHTQAHAFVLREIERATKGGGKEAGGLLQEA